MAACGSLSSLSENPTLIESLSSWNQILPKEPVDNACFTEIFGELHFKEKPSNPVHQTPPPSAVDRTLSFHFSNLTQKKCGNGSNSSFDSLLGLPTSQYICDARCNDSFPLKSSDKLQLCTERLGSESSDDVDDLIEEDAEDWSGDHWKEEIDAEGQAPVNGGHSSNSSKCSDVRTRTGVFPPPISSIGKCGKPWICFRPYRQNGRFVLREIRFPSQEFLHASREDGRLKLQLVHPDEDIPEGDEDDEEQDEEELEEEEEKAEDGKDNDY